MEDWELYGFIREDDNIYYLRNLAGEEGLIYDFNVSINDIVEINNPFGFMTLEAKVINIDSVLIEPANEYRKRITLFEEENFGYEEQWIEGIGSLAGITQSGWDMSVLTGGYDYTLLCYYEESELQYSTSLYPLCFYPIVGTSMHYAIDYINLYPNPVKNTSYLILENPNQRNLVVKLFNSLGNLIEEYAVTTPTKISIYTNNYPKGIYFYQVIDESRPIKNEKFIVY